MDLMRRAEEGRLPTALVRLGIRRQLGRRLRREDPGSLEAEAEREEAFVNLLSEAPLRIDADLANAQHYEVPAAFFERVLGPSRKYSGCLWPPGVHDLEAAEKLAESGAVARSSPLTPGSASASRRWP